MSQEDIPIEPYFKVADLFCGGGGAGFGLAEAGFIVEGWDINPQPRYPFTFHQGNALDVDLTGFDFVWASPPCQAHCAMKVMKNARKHLDLIPETRAKLKAWGGPWIMENVFGAPLISPVMLCGSMFGLGSNGFGLRRHRYFESNIDLTHGLKCNHDPKTLGVYGDKVRNIAQEKRHYAKDKATRGEPIGVVLPQRWGMEAMQTPWMNIHECSQAIPPKYSEFLAEIVMKKLIRRLPQHPTNHALA